MLNYYSTNSWMSFIIQRYYRGDIFYVWCSECFDPRAEPTHSPLRLIPESSSPAGIYRRFLRAIDPFDSGDAKIAAVGARFVALATEWHRAGEIGDLERDEILAMTASQDGKVWRPVLFVIQKALVATRIESVPPVSRAGLGPEFRIQDLRSAEFDVLEFNNA